jgi:hypothetical protein
MIGADGALDRAACARWCCDPGARQRLEAIVHPLVGQQIERQARAAEAPATPGWCSTFRCWSSRRALARAAGPRAGGGLPAGHADRA